MKNLRAKVFFGDNLIAENADVSLEFQENTFPLPTWQGEIFTKAHLKIGSYIYTLVLSDGRKGKIRIRKINIDSQSYLFLSNDGFK